MTSVETGEPGATLTYSLVTPALGAVTLNANGTFNYDPNNVASFESIPAGQTATDSFTYKVVDNHGQSATATVTIDVSVNDAGPVATGFTASTDEDSAITNASLGVTSVETGEPGATLTYSLVTPALGAVTLNANGTFNYDPNNVASFESIPAGQTATDSFTYKVVDNHGQSATATVTIDVSVNDAGPVATGFTASTDENSAITNASLGVTSVETGEPGATLTYSLVTPALGAVTLNANGTFNYDPNNVASFESIPAGQTATDSFTYKVVDNHGQSATATVTIDVSVNDAGPVATGFTASTDEDSAITNASLGVTSVETGEPGATLTYSLVTPALGAVTLNANGTFNYDPNNVASFESIPAGQTATDSFTYKVVDNHGQSATATVTIDVSVNDAGPVATGFTASTDEDSAITNASLGVTSVETGEPGATLTYSLVTPALGAVTLNANGTFNYDPNNVASFESIPAGQTATDSFTYKVVDNHGQSATATVTIDVSVNDAGPVATGFTASTDEDSAITNASLGVTSVETGEPGATLTYSLVTPALGAVTLNANGTFNYDPNNVASFESIPAGQTATDSFTYKVVDNHGQSATATVTIDVSVNDAGPVATGFTASTDENSAITNASLGVTSVETGEPGATLTYSLVTPALGAVTLNANGTFNYDPNNVASFESIPAGQTATDSFTYKVVDNHGQSATATVTIDVSVNDAGPVATGFTASTDEDSAITNASLGVTSVETGEPGATLTYSLVTPALGAVTLNANGTFNYDPNNVASFESIPAGQTATDSFTYKVVDNHGQSATATVTIDVSVNDAGPVATGFTASTDEDSAITNASLGVTSVETGEPGATLTYSLVTPALGAVTLNANGTFNYDPNNVASFESIPAGQTATDSFTYKVVDNHGQSATATVTIDVSVNDAGPVATGFTASTDEDSAITNASLGVTSVETGEPGATLTYSLVTPALGAVTLNANGTFNYDPNNVASFESIPAGQTATDSFTYKVVDNHGQSATATVTIDVSVNDAGPVATGFTASTDEDSAITNASLGVTSVETGEPGATLTYSLVTPALGAVTLNANGTFNYDPNNVASFESIPAGQTATDSFTYKVVDNHGQSATATVTIDVSVNDAGPVATGFTASTDENSAITNASLGVTSVETGEPGATLTYSLVTPALGAVTLNANGTFNYDPNNVASFESIPAGQTATDSFTYKVVDNHGQSATATVTIDVSVNDAGPVATGFTASTDEDSAITNASLGVTSVETGEPGATLTYSLVTPALGAVTLNANGTFNYDPNNVASFESIPAGQTATDSFTYKVVDNHGQSATATVTIDVSVNDAGPVATGFTASTDEDSAITNASLGVTSVETGEPGATLTYSLVTPALGAVTLNANGTFNYDPNNVASFESIPAGQTATDSFTYKVVDNHGQSATATVTIDVSVNDAGPVATGFTASADEDSAITNASLGVTSVEPGSRARR